MKIKQIKNCTLEELKTYAKNSKITFTMLCAMNDEREIDLDLFYEEPQVNKKALEDFIKDMKELDFEIVDRDDNEEGSFLEFRKPNNYYWELSGFFSYKEGDCRSIMINLIGNSELKKGVDPYKYDLDTLKNIEESLQEDIEYIVIQAQRVLKELKDFTKGVDKLINKYLMEIKWWRL